MAKTFQTCVTEARELLQDTDTDQTRYTDSTLLNILNRGLHDLSKIRPDLTYLDYANNSLEVPEIVETGAGAGQMDWTDPWPWEMWFYNRMVEYTVAVAEITDDEYTVDGRAALLIQQFRNGAIGL
jgi:hypothetical protein